MELCLYAVDIGLQALQTAIPDFGHTAIVAFALGLVGLEAQALHFLLVLLNLRHKRFFSLPFSPELSLLLFELVYFLVQMGQFVAALTGVVAQVLTADSLSLNLQLFQLSVQFVEFLRHRVALHAELGCRLIHEVYGLVGQETV